MCNIYNVIFSALNVAVFAVQSATLSTVCKIARLGGVQKRQTVNFALNNYQNRNSIIAALSDYIDK